MKKLISLSILFFFLFLAFFSCQKSVEEKLIYQTDTLFIKDTIFLHDTIQHFDTLFIFDTIIHTDTIVIIDTIIMQDTSEFDYLFKHYELDTYEVVFQLSDVQKNNYQICTMSSDAHDYNIIENGNGLYPIWSQDSGKVVYVDFNELAIVEEDIESGEKDIIWNMDRNIMFIWYSPVLDLYIASYPDGDLDRLVAINYHNGTTIELTEDGVDEVQPSTSDVDDWIYFSRRDNGSLNIYRRKLEPGFEEPVYIDPEYNLTSFKVSADGKFLVSPKNIDDRGYVVFYDIERHQIIREVELPVEGYPMYTTLSKDNKAIFFVNGESFNFGEVRNIYRMAFDKTQLFQLTNFEHQLAIRPLVR